MTWPWLPQKGKQESLFQLQTIFSSFFFFLFFLSWTLVFLKVQELKVLNQCVIMNLWLSLRIKGHWLKFWLSMCHSSERLPRTAADTGADLGSLSVELSWCPFARNIFEWWFGDRWGLRNTFCKYVQLLELCKAKGGSNLIGLEVSLKTRLRSLLEHPVQDVNR